MHNVPIEIFELDQGVVVPENTDDGKGDVSASKIERICRQLRDPQGPDVVLIGTLPPDILAHWPNRVTDELIITRNRRDHYLDIHPELEEYEEDIVRVLLKPEVIYEMNDAPMSAVFCARQGIAHDIAVLVRIADTEGLQNSVITCRRQRARKRGKPVARNSLVWQKGK